MKNPIDPNSPKERVTDKNICIIGVDGMSMCQGDSGGPTIYNGEQIGLNSFSPEVCGSDRPVANICVPDYINWIGNKIGLLSSLLGSVTDIVDNIL